MAAWIGPAIGLATSVVGGLLGRKADKKQNKLAEEQLRTDRAMADRQIEISRYIEKLAKDLMTRNGGMVDPYGGGIKYNPETKQYEYSLGGAQRDIQGASDKEELARVLQDNAIRRAGLNDFERMRKRSSDQGDRVFDELMAARRGINRVDARQLGAQLRTDRTRALNAGYDDAERAAQTLQLRTGSSAVGDALSALARDRVRAQASIGSPELEGLQMAEGINNEREDRDYNRYKLFGDEARGFYDTGFAPSTYDATQYARLMDLAKLDLSRYDLAMGGSGQAAGTIGDAAAGLRQGFQLFNQSRIHSPDSKFITGLGNAISASDLFKGIKL